MPGIRPPTTWRVIMQKRSNRTPRPRPAVSPRLRLEPLEAREVPALIGALDPSFGTAGKVSVDLGGTDALTDVAIQADGKIVAVGSTTVGGTSDFLIVRFNSDGTQDMTFNNN